MTLRRLTVVTVAMLVASALPVLDLQPAYAAPPTHATDLHVGGWSGGEYGAASAEQSRSGMRTSAVVPADDVVLVGADWGGDHDAIVQVRTRRDGAWSDWTELHFDDDHLPDVDGTDEDRSSTASDPLWVGAVDALQFRTSVDPSTVRFSGVEVEGGEKALRARPNTGPASQANAATTKPTIITRAQWGADESWRNGDPNYATDVRFAVVHHTAGTNSYQSWESDDIVRSIYSYHTRSRGWDDIGYNFLVDKYGQVFEGRAGGIERAVMGAHAAGFNSGSTGVAVMGNFGSSNPPAAAVTALRNLLAWKLDVHHVDPTGTTQEEAGNGSRFPSGTDVTIKNVVGHRDVGYTSCPGDRLYQLINSGSLAQDVRNTGLPKLFTDMPASLQQPRGDGLTIDVTPTERVDWELRVADLDGNVLHQQTGNSSEPFEATWDHKGPNGLLVPTGNYVVTLSAVGSSGNARPIEVALHIVQGPPKGDPNANPVPPPAGAKLLTGDWDGDGMDSPGWFKNGEWGLHDRAHAQGNTMRLSYGQAGDIPVVGDWDGDGIDTIGVVRPTNDGRLRWLLRNKYVSGNKALDMYYGVTGDIPVTGDWDADDDDTIGIVRRASDDRLRWILRNRYVSGNTALDMYYGVAGDKPVTGDWDADGDVTIGIVREGDRWILRNRYVSGDVALDMYYGTEGDIPVTGDWDADERDTIGIIRDDLWVLRNHYRRDAVDYTFQY